MRRDMVVSRYVIPIGIPRVDGLSTGPSGFEASQLVFFFFFLINFFNQG